MTPEPTSETKPGPQPPKPGDPPRPRKMYVGYMFEPGRHRRAQGALEVAGTVRWTVRDLDKQSIDQFMTAWDEKGYKMGLLVLKGQRIEGITYAGLDTHSVAMAADPASIPDLHATLGTPDGYEWLAFASKGRRKYTIVASNVVEFEVGIRITPAQAGPQIIPVASRHVDGTFAQSYMPGLWVLPA